MKWHAYIHENIYMHVNAHSCNVYVNPKWKQHKCLSTLRWASKFWYIHTMQDYKAIKICKPFPYPTAWIKEARHKQIILHDAIHIHFKWNTKLIMVLIIDLLVSLISISYVNNIKSASLLLKCTYWPFFLFINLIYK